jgi:transcriptional regulator with XRE-family HTH domain
MENPYRQARINANMTQKEVASTIGVTPQTVLMVEQGLFNVPPTAIESIFPNRRDSYIEWRTHTRYHHSQQWEPNYKSQAWLDFRQSISPSFKGFCVQLCFQPSLLREFETKWYSRDLLIEALLEANIYPSYADSITERNRVLRGGIEPWASSTKQTVP